MHKDKKEPYGRVTGEEKHRNKIKGGIWGYGEDKNWKLKQRQGSFRARKWQGKKKISENEKKRETQSKDMESTEDKGARVLQFDLSI